jgi:predicted transcriptional regulator
MLNSADRHHAAFWRPIMPSAKEQMTSIINAQPDDAPYDEIMRELAFARMVDRGLDDVRNGRVVSHEETKRRIISWGA